MGPGLRVSKQAIGIRRLASWEEDWRRMVPGTLVFIESDVPHAMRTFDERALFAWTGDLNSLPRLVPTP